jgi:hypothetical protein
MGLSKPETPQSVTGPKELWAAERVKVILQATVFVSVFEVVNQWQSVESTYGPKMGLLSIKAK